MYLVPIDETGNSSGQSPDPDPIIASVLLATMEMYGRKGYQPPWICYLANEGDKWVGTCGFNGPQLAGEVEISYFTFPGNEAAGVATRMASALLLIARGFRPVPPAILAHTLPEENASTSILRKLGFSFAGEVSHPVDGDIWQWRLMDGEAAQLTGESP